MENDSSLSTCSDYIEVARESSAESDLTMIAEVPLTAAGSTIQCIGFVEADRGIVRFKSIVVVAVCPNVADGLQLRL